MPARFLPPLPSKCLSRGVKNDAEIYRLVTKATIKELKILLAGTSAGPLLEDGNERMFGSVRATASSAVRALNYTTQQQGPSFSVRKWVKTGAAVHAGWGGWGAVHSLQGGGDCRAPLRYFCLDSNRNLRCASEAWRFQWV